LEELVQARINRLFHRDSGRCLNIAVDHGFFGQPSFLRGIEDMPGAIDQLVAAGPDAIQLTPGQAPLLQQRAGKDKPALVIRTDIANVYGTPLPRRLFSRAFPDAVEQAVRLDAACVVANLLSLPDQPAVLDQCVDIIMRLRSDCTRYGMPLMVEPLVMQDNATAGGYMVDGETEKIVALVRQARELGADLIKADPTDRTENYHLVVQAAQVPVLVRGGGKVADRELLERTAAVLEQGAAGIVYGRNIIQHESPSGITKALLALLHHGASVDEAFELIKAQP
jgi:class I fructose-bisphosphate aldolase